MRIRFDGRNELRTGLLKYVTVATFKRAQLEHVLAFAPTQPLKRPNEPAILK
jgi:hypothetical protein